MKKLLLTTISLALLFSYECSVQIPHIPSIKITESVDYAKFAPFFITESNSVSSEYQPKPSLTTTHIQGVDGKTMSLWTMQEISSQNESRSRTNLKDDVYSNVPSARSQNTKAERITLEGALEELVNVAKEYNANGIINLKIKPIIEHTTESTYTVGYEVSGMAIRR